MASKFIFATVGLVVLEILFASKINVNFDLSSYDDKIRVNTVFGTGLATTTDSPGLIGEINAPVDCVYDEAENYLYLTDVNGGGLLRKLAVALDGLNPNDLQYSKLFGVKTVFYRC